MEKYANMFSSIMASLVKGLGKPADALKGALDSPLSKGLILGGAFITGTVFADFLAKVLAEKYDIYKSKDYFKEMLKMHPQLKEFPVEEVAKYYRSLYHFAPTVAKDPLAAGAYLTQSLKKLSGEELGGPPPDTFNTLAEIERKVVDAKKSKMNQSAARIYEGVATSAVRSAFDGSL